MSDRLTWDLIIRDKATATISAFRKQLESLAKSESSDAEKGLDKVLKGVDGVAGGFQKATAFIGTGAYAMTHAAGAAQGLAASSVALSGVVGLLPGVFSAAGVGALTFKLGTSGMSQAFKDASGPAQKFQGDLKNLSHQQRNFVGFAAEQEGALKNLKHSIGDHMFVGLGKEIAPLADKYLPGVKTSLDKVGDSFNSAAKTEIGFLKQNGTVAKVKGLFSDSASAAGDFTKVLKPMSGIILDIVSASAHSLSGITSNLGHAGDSAEKFFDNFTDGGKGGQFAKWVGTGITSAEQLGSSFLSVGRIVANVFSAGGGSLKSPLGNLADDMKRVEKETESPAFKTGVKTVFGDISRASDDVQRSLPGLVKSFGPLVPTLGKIINGGGSAFGSELRTWTTLIRIGTPLISGFVMVLGPLAPVLGAVVPPILLASKGIRAWTAISGVVKLVKEWTVVQKLLDAELIANPIGLVVAAIALLAVGLVVAYKKSQTFRDIINGAFKAVAKNILNNINSILGVFGDLFGVLGHLPGKAGAPFRAMSGYIKTAQGKVNSLISAINRIPSHKNSKITITTLQQTETSSIAVKGGHLTKMATGGPVRANHPYIVGDGGRPELFVPTQSGTIIPKVPAGAGTPYGGGDVHYHLHYNGNLVGTPAQVRDALVDLVKRAPAGGAKFPASAVAAR